MSLRTESLEITPEILSLVAELDEFKGAWQALGALPPQRLAALRRIATIESIGASTRIEGNRLSDVAIKRLLDDREHRPLATHDEQEAAGYAEVVETILAHADAIDLTEDHIRRLHRGLLVHCTRDADHRGDYKTAPNQVGSFEADGRAVDIAFETATPLDTPRLMTALVEGSRQVLDGRQLHPLLVIAIFIVIFLGIHPFKDGNGPLSRLLTTLLLLRSGYAYVPYSSLESVIEQSRDSYYLALRATQATIRGDTPEWQPWILYFLLALRQQKNRLGRKLEREKALAGMMPKLSAEILELAKDHGRLTIGQIATLTAANRNTVKKHLRSLVAANHLAQHGTGKGTWYSAA